MSTELSRSWSSLACSSASDLVPNAPRILIMNSVCLAPSAGRTHPPSRFPTNERHAHDTPGTTTLSLARRDICNIVYNFFFNYKMSQKVLIYVTMWLLLLSFIGVTREPKSLTTLRKRYGKLREEFTKLPEE